MVETLVPLAQRTDEVGMGGSPRARAWTLAVACMGVALVVASMTALNTALGDLAVATAATQTQLTWIVDGYTLSLACLLLPAGAIGDRYGRRGALHRCCGDRHSVRRHVRVLLHRHAIRAADHGLFTACDGILLRPVHRAAGYFSALSFWYVPKLRLRLVLFVGTLLMAIGFGCMYRLGLHPTYFEFTWPTLILATGIGICTAQTTSAIMGAVPDEKQGVASAANDTSREMGGALGIAVAGSILAGRYSHELAPRLADFPAPVRAQASDSLAKAVEVAGKLGPQGQQLAEISKSAFLAALHASTVTMAVIVALAAVAIGLWAPGRDGRQLRPVRALLSRGRH